VVERVADEILGIRIDRAAARASAPPLENTNRIKLTPADRERVEATLARLARRHTDGAGTPSVVQGDPGDCAP
jgi:hypothetical protein